MKGMNILSWEINQRNDNIAHFLKVVNKINVVNIILCVYFHSVFVQIEVLNFPGSFMFDYGKN